MAAEQLLRDRLGSFLRQREKVAGRHLQADFVCPPQLVTLLDCLPGFDWMGVNYPARVRVFGIRKLVDLAPFRLSDLRALGFRTESTRHPIRPPVKGFVEHYLVAELLTPETARVYLCMHVPADKWYVLDEHLLTREAD
jgi:hypothetical protein